MRKIAVPFENGDVYYQCCRAPKLKVYSIKNDMLSKIEIMDIAESGPDATASLFEKLDIKVVICGYVSPYLRELMEQNLHMEVYSGVEGDADSAVVAYLAGTLDFEPNMHIDAPTPIYDCSGRGGDWSGID